MSAKTSDLSINDLCKLQSIRPSAINHLLFCSSQPLYLTFYVPNIKSQLVYSHHVPTDLTTGSTANPWLAATPTTTHLRNKTLTPPALSLSHSLSLHQRQPEQIPTRTSKCPPPHNQQHPQRTSAPSTAPSCANFPRDLSPPAHLSTIASAPPSLHRQARSL